MSVIRSTSLMIIGLFLIAGTGYADILKMENTEPTVVEMDNRPARGMSQEQVIDLYGEPMARTDAVGEPPISSWNYTGFTVFFEHQYVIHTVNHTNAEKGTENP
jgi:hypothetical protein